mmetsp:Transcript_11827/g.47737  ORF Transcript_11827/g.47737 Transcript_11827/m.47737 type:complete len:376 (+) Transcript_11827:591-1718(+)
MDERGIQQPVPAEEGDKEVALGAPLRLRHGGDELLLHVGVDSEHIAIRGAVEEELLAVDLWHCHGCHGRRPPLAGEEELAEGSLEEGCEHCVALDGVAGGRRHCKGQLVALGEEETAGEEGNARGGECARRVEEPEERAEHEVKDVCAVLHEKQRSARHKGDLVTHYLAKCEVDVLLGRAELRDDNAGEGLVELAVLPSAPPRVLHAILAGREERRLPCLLHCPLGSELAKASAGEQLQQRDEPLCWSGGGARVRHGNHHAVVQLSQEELLHRRRLPHCSPPLLLHCLPSLSSLRSALHWLHESADRAKWLCLEHRLPLLLLLLLLYLCVGGRGHGSGAGEGLLLLHVGPLLDGGAARCHRSEEGRDLLESAAGK